MADMKDLGWLNLAKEATPTLDYPRKAVIVEEGKAKIITLKDVVHDLAVDLKTGGNFAYVSPEYR